jgi:hypothetical protein
LPNGFDWSACRSFGDRHRIYSAPCARAPRRSRIARLTTISTKKFTASATMSMLRSWTSGGSHGRVWKVRAAQAEGGDRGDAAMMPAAAPSRVAMLRCARLRTSAGNGWVTRLS